MAPAQPFPFPSHGTGAQVESTWTLEGEATAEHHYFCAGCQSFVPHDEVRVITQDPQSQKPCWIQYHVDKDGFTCCGTIATFVTQQKKPFLC